MIIVVLVGERCSAKVQGRELQRTQNRLRVICIRDEIGVVAWLLPKVALAWVDHHHRRGSLRQVG